MYKGIYEFANIKVEINSLYEYIHKMCAKYKISNNEDVKYVINITEDDIKRENEKSKGQEYIDFPLYYLETLAVYRKFLAFSIFENVFLFHSSSFMIDGKAYIITAPSGTGKSTHARFLSEVYKERFVCINDDKPLIRYENDEFMVYGTPWNGKHGLDNNVCYPLKAIFVLNRGEVDSVDKMIESVAFNFIFSQVHKPTGKDEMKLIINLLSKMAHSIPCYLLKATNRIEATEASRKIIDNKN